MNRFIANTKECCGIQTVMVVFLKIAKNISTNSIPTCKSKMFIFIIFHTRSNTFSGMAPSASF